MNPGQRVGLFTKRKIIISLNCCRQRVAENAHSSISFLCVLETTSCGEAFFSYLQSVVFSNNKWTNPEKLVTVLAVIEDFISLRMPIHIVYYCIREKTS